MEFCHLGPVKLQIIITKMSNWLSNTERQVVPMGLEHLIRVQQH
jgi:hypothetical protein